LNQPVTNWDSEFDKLVEQLRKSFTQNRIQDFLTLNTRMNSLFTSKLQFLIDKKDHFIEEHTFNVDPVMLKKLDDFNNNFTNLMDTHEKLKLENKELKDKSDKNQQP